MLFKSSIAVVNNTVTKTVQVRIAINCYRGFNLKTLEGGSKFSLVMHL